MCSAPVWSTWAQSKIQEENLRASGQLIYALDALLEMDWRHQMCVQVMDLCAADVGPLAHPRLHFELVGVPFRPHIRICSQRLGHPKNMSGMHASSWCIWDQVSRRRPKTTRSPTVSLSLSPLGRQAQRQTCRDTSTLFRDTCLPSTHSFCSVRTSHWRLRCPEPGLEMDLVGDMFRNCDCFRCEFEGLSESKMNAALTPLRSQSACAKHTRRLFCRNELKL